MWAVVVVVSDERIEAGLLLEDVRRCGLGGFGLECAMHALVPAVLLRVAGGDPFDPDPETQPPHRELAEAIEGSR